MRTSAIAVKTDMVDRRVPSADGSAARDSPAPHAPHVAVWIDRSGPGSTTANWTIVSDPIASSPSMVRIQAIDLREAQRKTAKTRAEVAARGGDATSVMVLVDVDVMIASDPRTAHTEWSRLAGDTNHPTDSLVYVGTAKGLAGLIADIHAAQVADGVTLVPRTPDVLDRILDEGLAHLEEAGLEVSQSQLAFVSRCRDNTRTVNRSTEDHLG
ncbi:hypothetical protein [Mycobacterium sp. E1747]|uniref:hypothetical protein n=1 Tax=Mycobacterium sp. E1747 TaxID=1834128 RepID=UPI0012EA17A4|nr:hypothetical protein [Mycobacterium sp. E1747]